MFKFLLRIIIICFPALLLVVWLEHGLGKLKTHYQLKQNFFEGQKNEIEILSLGSSNAYYGINPQYFSCPGFNFAYNGQSPYYDLKLIEKYSNELPKLKLVIIPAIFFTVGLNLSDPKNGNYWRLFFYKHYYQFKNENTLLTYSEILIKEFDPRNFSLIAVHRDNIYTHIKNHFSGLIDAIPEKSGWYDSSTAPLPDLSKNIGPDGAKAHSITYDEDTAIVNLANWQKLINFLKQRGIDVVIIRVPEHESYLKNLDKNKNEHFTNGIKSLAFANGIRYLDYSADNRFYLTDYIYYVDHLNPKGAKKFSEIINHDFIETYCVQ